MAKSIMIQGTTSGAGKSLITAGLCRILSRKGYRVAPFKSQNMALNSFITKDGLEMGRAQVMQAQCAGIDPDVRMNPILLKPSSNVGSQVIVNGEIVGNMSAAEYFARKKTLLPLVKDAYDSLASEYDIIVLEGAGSPAEINLRQEDIVNMGMAKMVGAPVLLVGDINPGGVFASIAGTCQLLQPWERAHIRGILINKFRGDPEILKPGLSMLEGIVRKPVLGVIPYMDIDVDDEDSLSHRLVNKSGGVLDVAVIRLPRLSNFTDFSPLAAMEEVGLRYVDSPNRFGAPDLVIIPGTKNTMGDMEWLRNSGMEARILAYAGAGKPILGICGGYQMLGEHLSDPDGMEEGGEIAGLGLLPTKTVFYPQKVRAQVSGTICTVPGIFSSLSGEQFEGYEIHMGKTTGQVEHPFAAMDMPQGETQLQGACNGNIYGTYAHGILDAPEVCRKIVVALMETKGLRADNVKAIHTNAYREQQYNLMADELEASLEMQKIMDIIEGS